MSRRFRALALACGCALPAPAVAQDRADLRLDEIVVTATGRPEPRSAIAGTVQVIDRTTIENSTGTSVTDVLAENAVGFFSEWTPGQTSINIRGGATDGQGKDFRSQVLVLMNGRRAGTANLSKLSIADVERIEIVRGPSSVIYGSQNIGGVINIILKTGRTAPGTLVEGIGGVWGLAQGRAQTGGVVGPFDYYLGVSGGKRDDYVAGSGDRMANTQWNRMGIAGALGLQIDPNQRVEFTLRTDGIYGVGFRGSGGNLYSRDDRINGSFDASYTGRTEDGRASLFAQVYSVTDEDRFKWASPIQRGGTGLPVPGTRADFNTRDLDILGTRFQPRVTLFSGNDVLLGWDWETSRLRSDRFRAGVPGNPLAQVSPQDNNQTDQFHALYLEDTQRLLDDRLVLRAGVRQTYGTTSFDFTPYLTGRSTARGLTKPRPPRSARPTRRPTGRRSGSGPPRVSGRRRRRRSRRTTTPSAAAGSSAIPTSGRDERAGRDRHDADPRRVAARRGLVSEHHLGPHHHALARREFQYLGLHQQSG